MAHFIIPVDPDRAPAAFVRFTATAYADAGRGPRNPRITVTLTRTREGGDTFAVTSGLPHGATADIRLPDVPSESTLRNGRDARERAAYGG